MAGEKPEPGDGPPVPLLCPLSTWPCSLQIFPSFCPHPLRHEKGQKPELWIMRHPGKPRPATAEPGMSRQVFIPEAENTYWLFSALSQGQPDYSTLPRAGSTEFGVPGPPSLSYICVHRGDSWVARGGGPGVGASRGCSITTSRGGQCHAAGSTVRVWWPKQGCWGQTSSVGGQRSRHHGQRRRDVA